MLHFVVKYSRMIKWYILLLNIAGSLNVTFLLLNMAGWLNVTFLMLSMPR